MQRLKILIVDDDPEISEFIRIKLSRDASHFDIAKVPGGQDCLEYLKERQVDCILSDYQMPGMDGMALLKRLIGSGDSTPFIFVTGQGSEEVAREAFKNGAYDYFTKDIGFAHFARIINSIEQAVRQRVSEEVRAKAEAELLEEKTKLAAVLDSMGDGVSIQDGEYRIVYQNQAMKEMVGDFVGRFCYEAYQESEGVCGDCPIAASYREGRPRTVSKTIRKGGGLLHAEITASCIKDDSGGIRAGVEVVRDVTRRIRSEEALRRSTDNYLYLFERNPNPMLIYDFGTLSVLDVNEAAVRLYGYTREEFLSMTIKDLRPAEDVPALLKFLSGVDPGLSESGEWTHRKKDGTLLRVEVTSHGLTFGGRVARAVLVRDVSERKKTEERYKTLVELSTDFIYMSDRHGNQTFMNDAAYSLLEAAPEDVIGRPWARWIHPDDRERVVASFREMIENGLDVLDLECRMVTKGGRVINVLHNVRVSRDAHGEVVGTQGIARDITGLRRAEEERSGMFHMMTHDINSPLSVILGYNDLPSFGKDEEAALILSDIQKAARRIKSVIDDMLALTRIESRKAPPAIRRVSVRELLGQAVKETERAAAVKDITVELYADPALPPVYADPSLLSHAFWNLAANAVNYNRKGGAVRIRARLLDDDPSMVGIEFSDDGDGIPEEDLQKVFQKFYRCRKARAQGTGLGLAIVKAVVEAHGGTVSVKSSAGAGSTFSVVLPVRQDGAGAT